MQEQMTNKTKLDIIQVLFIFKHLVLGVNVIDLKVKCIVQYSS